MCGSLKTNRFKDSFCETERHPEAKTTAANGNVAAANEMNFLKRMNRFEAIACLLKTSRGSRTLPRHVET
jgi:hypothetical protein